jgi:hypothetical protein
MTYIDFIEHRHQHLEKEKKNIEVTNENIEKIKKHWSTKEIAYPEYKEVYDYVDALFPHCNVKDVVVHKANKEYLAKMGFEGIGGFCHKSSKSVILSSHSKQRPKRVSKYQIIAKIQPDEVIVHELLHYCYFFEKNPGQSMHLQEEFAYGYSVDYLRGKGFTDNDIIKNNFLPYFYRTEEDKFAVTIMLQKENITRETYQKFSYTKKQRIYKKHRSIIYDRVIEESYKRGRKVIEIYSKLIDKKRGVEEEVTVQSSKVTKFDFLDI